MPASICAMADPMLWHFERLLAIKSQLANYPKIINNANDLTAPSAEYNVLPMPQLRRALTAQQVERVMDSGVYKTEGNLLIRTQDPQRRIIEVAARLLWVSAEVTSDVRANIDFRKKQIV